MSGQREQWDGLDQPDQPDPLDSTLIMTRLFGRSVPDHENGSGNGSGNGNGNGNGASAGTGSGVAASGAAPAPVSYLTPDATTGRHRTMRTVPDRPGDPGQAPVIQGPDLAPAPDDQRAAREQTATPQQAEKLEQAAAPEQAAEPEQAASPRKPTPGLSLNRPQPGRQLVSLSRRNGPRIPARPPAPSQPQRASWPISPPRGPNPGQGPI